LPVAFPAGVDNIRSHLSGIMFYLLFHKEITQILATVLMGRVIAVPVPEEIHGDSCGNAQWEDPAGKKRTSFFRGG
ncbi:hypothetical protein ACW0TQ_16840, partial [Oceanobacillus sp. M60]